MNSLWPATSRISCLNPRTIFQTCQKVDSLAVRLVRGYSRTYSNPSIPYPQGGSLAWEQGRTIWRGSSVLNALGFPRRTFASKRIVNRFDQLPRNYKDDVGLAYRETPLSEKEAREIFQNQVDAGMANKILRILHGRRVAGTLDDPSMKLHNTETRVVNTALAWLRKNVPVNEVESAGLRAEQELAQIEADIVSDAERIGLYKPNSKEPSKATKGSDIYAPNSRPMEKVYVEGAFEKVRKANEKKWEEEQAAVEAKRKKQAEEIGQNTGTLEVLTERSKVELRRPGENPWLKHYLEKAKFLPDEPLQMTPIKRIWPSLLATIAVILGSLVLVEVYTPPKRKDRLWPDMPPSAATIIGIILLNTVFFVAWRFPPALRFMNKNAMFYPGYPKVTGLLGSIFSHQSLQHYAANMVVLWWVGTRLHDEIGRANFLAVYMSAGTLGGLSSLMFWTLKNSFISSSLGASGAVCGIIACYLILNSSEKITLFGVFPPEGWPSISGMVFLMLLVATDLYGIRKHSKKITIDHANHLGGYAAGIAGAGLLRMKIKRQKEAEIERRKNMGFIDKIKEGKI